MFDEDERRDKYTPKSKEIKYCSIECTRAYWNKRNAQVSVLYTGKGALNGKLFNLKDKTERQYYLQLKYGGE